MSFRSQAVSPLRFATASKGPAVAGVIHLCRPLAHRACRVPPFRSSVARMPSPEELIAWLNDEGILDLPPEFSPDGDLFAAGLDSMAVMQLVVAVEERCAVVLDAADLTKANLSTARALAGLIRSKSS